MKAQGATVGRYAGLLFPIAFAQALGSNVGLGVVLDRLGAAGLPTLMMLHAGVLAATILAATRTASAARGPVARWLSAALMVTALLVVGIAFLDTGKASWLASVLYLVTHVFGDITVALFWVLVTQVFDMRAAKRAFPGLGAAGTAGAAFAGFLTQGATGALGTRGLLLVLGAVLVVAAMRALSVSPTADVEPRRLPRQVRAAPSGFGGDGEDARLGRAIVLGAVVVSAVTLVGRYLYARSLEGAYGGDATLIVAQNGLIMALGSLLTAVTQLVVLPTLMTRAGVVATMAIYPVAMIAVFGAMAAHFGLVTGILAHLATAVIRKGMLAPAEGILPAALPAEKTSRAVLLSSAVGAPAGMLLAGGALRYLRDAAPRDIAVFGLVLTAGLAAVTVWRATRYGSALRLRLRKGGSELRLRLAGVMGDAGDVRAILSRGFEPEDPALPARLETLLRLQREAEDSGDAAPVSAGALTPVIEHRLAEAYRLVAALDGDFAAGAPPGLMALWRGAVRHRLGEDIRIVLHALRASTGRRDLDHIVPRMFDVDPRARGAAVELLEPLCPAQYRDLLLPLIEGVDMQRGRVESEQRFGPPSADPIADLLDIPDDWLRAVTVYAIAAVEDRSYDERIAALRPGADRWLELACARALGKTAVAEDAPEASPPSEAPPEDEHPPSDEASDAPR